MRALEFFTKLLFSPTCVLFSPMLPMLMDVPSSISSSCSLPYTSGVALFIRIHIKPILPKLHSHSFHISTHTHASTKTSVISTPDLSTVPQSWQTSKPSSVREFDSLPHSEHVIARSYIFGNKLSIFFWGMENVLTGGDLKFLACSSSAFPPAPMHTKNVSVQLRRQERHNLLRGCRLKVFLRISSRP